MKSQFLANMSHEIKTPMNAILGYSNLLADYTHGEEEISYLNSIKKAGNSLTELLTDILDLSKIEANKIVLQKDFISIIKIFDEIKELFLLKLKEKGINLYINLDSSIPEQMLLDELRVKQVLLNLIGNAVKFTEEGYVEVTVNIETNIENLNLVNLSINIKDTGIGIPEEELVSIFDAFKQKDGQSNKKYGGTGLGLSISKGFIELMGGKLYVSSKLGEGSIFTVAIPNVLVRNDNEFEIDNVNLQQQVEDKTKGNEYIDENKQDNLLKTENDLIFVNSNLFSKLEELYNGLWKDCSKNNRLIDIKAFGKELKQIGDVYDINEICQYGNNLLEVASTFNLIKIRVLLEEYPKLLKIIRLASEKQ